MNIKENLLNPAERGVKYNYNRQVFFCLKKIYYYYFLPKNEWNVAIDITDHGHVERFN